MVFHLCDQKFAKYGAQESHGIPKATCSTTSRDSHFLTDMRPRIPPHATLVYKLLVIWHLQTHLVLHNGIRWSLYIRHHFPLDSSITLQSSRL
jgi:hypothetical protein